MAVIPPSKRGALLKSEQASGKIALFRITKDAQKRMEAEVSKAVRSPNFATSAAVRQRLYKVLGAEYAKLDAITSAWVKSEATSTAKTWYAIATNDISEGI